MSIAFPKSSFSLAVNIIITSSNSAILSFPDDLPCRHSHLLFTYQFSLAIRLSLTKSLTAVKQVLLIHLHTAISLRLGDIGR